MRTTPPSAKRCLDFDVETRAKGFGDPDWVPQEVTAMAWSWCDAEHVSYATLLDGVEYMFMSFLEAYNAADMVTGHNICMVPETRVLTLDLRWVPAGDLVVGDSLLAIEETPSGPRRLWEDATVTANRLDLDEVFAVTLETGEVLYATANHPWLVTTRPGTAVRHRWRRTDQLLGGPPARRGDFEKSPALLSRAVEPWQIDDSRDAGWLAGFFDGEGTMAWKQNRAKAQLVGAQNPGPTLDRVVDTARSKGFDTAATPAQGRACYRIRVNGGLPEKMRFLGQVRPHRLLDKWLTLAPGAYRSAQKIRVVAVESVGLREVSRLSTSSGTYIAEGYAVHNCRFDLPIIQSDLMRYDYPTLGAKKVQDTIRIRRTKGFKKGQDNLLTLLRVPEQKMALNWQQWQDAYEESDWATVIERVTSDVRGHKLLRAEMLTRGWLKPGRVWRP